MVTGRMFRTVAIALLFLSCNTVFLVPGRIKRDINCYDGKMANVTKVLDINGYYSRIETVRSNGDTIFDNCFFFGDGIFVRKVEIGSDHKKNLSGYVQSVAQNCKRHPRGGAHGLYWINGDTVKTQDIIFGMAGTKGAGETWFQIVDRIQIKSIYAMNLGEGKNNQGGYLAAKNIRTWTFVPVMESPLTSNSWLKKKKWFWCKDSNKNK